MSNKWTLRHGDEACLISAERAGLPPPTTMVVKNDKGGGGVKRKRGRSLSSKQTDAPGERNGNGR